MTRSRTTAAVLYGPAALLIAAHIAFMAYLRHLENR